MNTDTPVLFSERETQSGFKLGMATLNAEASLNSLTLEMIRLLHAQLDQWAEDESVAAVFLMAAGEKAFCAGGDVVALHAGAAGYGEELPNDSGVRFFEEEYRLDYAVHTYPKPIIAWGHGIIMGGGLGLFAGASHRVVTEKTRMAMPEVTIGLYPDVGGSWFLNRAPGRTGMFLGLTGASFNGADAKYVGLADRFLPHAQREAVIEAICSAGANNAQDFPAAIERILLNAEQAAAGEMPEGQVEQHFEQIQTLTDAETISQIFAQITGYDGDDTWLAKAAQGLANGCPITPHLVLEQLERAKDLSLADVFCMELIMSVQCLKQGHFKEGIRALLIDKDRNPVWQPAHVNEVTAEQVAGFFVEPWQQHPLHNL